MAGEKAVNKRHKVRAAGEGRVRVTKCSLHSTFSAHRRETECKQEVIAVEEAEAWRRLGRWKPAESKP